MTTATGHAISIMARMGYAKKGATAQFHQHFDMPSLVQVWASPMRRAAWLRCLTLSGAARLAPG
ncbi:hypothetical protein [Marinobacter sediminum]|uniref:hypothetical protein n=1 Tax=Marinobacter sediminum TaxID=256323 RepID=UPI00193AA7B2|nr:hypothetical protein [Marinobacter sediminum]